MNGGGFCRRARREAVGAEGEALVMYRPTVSQFTVVLGLAVLMALGPGGAARAQHTPDPFNIVGEYNLGYQDSMYSTYPNGIGFSPNQGLLFGNNRSGLARANQFSRYIEELDGVGSGSNSLYGPGSAARGQGGVEPYYRAHRQFDEAFNRVYNPNDNADQTYTKDQKARTEKYLAYLRESDPTKRAQLYREYTQESQRALRDLRSGTSRGSGATGRSTSPASAVPRTSTPAATRSGTRTPTSSLYRPPLSSPLRETPQQILERAELMDRANRAVSPRGASGSGSGSALSNDRRLPSSVRRPSSPPATTAPAPR
jgi:hypothetical protein